MRPAQFSLVGWEDMIKRWNSTRIDSMIIWKPKSKFSHRRPSPSRLTRCSYCNRIYQLNSPTSSIYLTLLHIYLRPNSNQIQVSPTDLLQAALDLISRHKPRLDPVETLNLLPPFVNANDVQGFLLEVLRAPVFGAKVVKCISKARNDAVARKLMVLQKRKVRVIDSRMYVERDQYRDDGAHRKQMSTVPQTDWEQCHRCACPSWWSHTLSVSRDILAQIKSVYGPGCFSLTQVLLFFCLQYPFYICEIGVHN